MSTFKRAVIIVHPDFQGEQGLKSASGYASQLATGAAQIIEHAREAGDPAVVEQLTRYLKGFRYLIRDLSDEVFK